MRHDIENGRSAAHRITAPHQIAGVDVNQVLLHGRRQRNAEVRKLSARTIKAIFRAPASAIAYLADRQAKAETYRQLQAMDDRMLADMGLNRFDIHDVVYGGAKRRETFLQSVVSAGNVVYVRSRAAVHQVAAGRVMDEGVARAA